MRISDWISDVCSSDRESVAALLGELVPAPADEEYDLPDQLSAALRASASPRIGEWAAARGRSREHVSRRFETLYGVSPAAYRADCQAKRAWRMIVGGGDNLAGIARSEEHTSELKSLMRISYAVFCLKKKNKNKRDIN